jgi:hypothetical protein
MVMVLAFMAVMALYWLSRYVENQSKYWEFVGVGLLIIAMFLFANILMNIMFFMV